VPEIPNEAWLVDYAKFGQTLCGMDYKTAAADARKWLHYDWEETYIARTPFPNDIVLFDRGEITYCIDCRFEPDMRLVANTEFVPVLPEQIKKEGRVVVAFGLSAPVTAEHPSSSGTGMRNFIGATEKYLGAAYDKGHFISHKLGGDINWNLFPQLRKVNRGWSAAGKRFREMEKFCQSHPGIFFFSRPLYSNFTSRPSALEYGILMEDLSFWVEIFSNVPE